MFLFFIFAVIASLLAAVILKVIAVLLKIEKRSFLQCYIGVLLCFSIVGPISYFGFTFFVQNPLLFFIVKLIIFGLVIRFYLETELNKAAIVGIIFSLLFNISMNLNQLPPIDKQSAENGKPSSILAMSKN